MSWLESMQSILLWHFELKLLWIHVILDEWLIEFKELIDLIFEALILVGLSRKEIHAHADKTPVWLCLLFSRVRIEIRICSLSGWGYPYHMLWNWFICVFTLVQYVSQHRACFSFPVSARSTLTLSAWSCASSTLNGSWHCCPHSFFDA